MMKDSDDPYGIAFDVVQNAMAAMREGADRRSDLGSQGTRKGMPAKKIECLLEASEIGLGLVQPEFGKAVVEYPRQIGGCLRSKPNLSHAAPR